MKVAGSEIVHKSDAGADAGVGGVILNIQNEVEVRNAFNRLMSIRGAEGVNVHP